jgi:hypothetical protein
MKADRQARAISVCTEYKWMSDLTELMALMTIIMHVQHGTLVHEMRDRVHDCLNVNVNVY